MLQPSCHSAAICASRRGFTLVELLTVIAIIAILAAILIPSVSYVRRSARTTQDLANMRTFGQAMMQYAADNRGRINLNTTRTGKEGYPLNTFMGRAWPYLETRGLSLAGLTAAQAKELSDRYVSQVLLHERDDLIATQSMLHNTLAMNKGLAYYKPGEVIADPEKTHDNFRRLSDIARPASTIYAAVGVYGFNVSGLTTYRPEPLPDNLPTEEIYWPYSGQRTILIYLDGHTAFWGDPITPSMYKYD